MADHNQEIIIRAQLVHLLDRLPEIDLTSAEDAAASQLEEPTEEQSNNRWGFTFRSKVKDDPKSGGTMGLQGA
jgi:hypothetical protein